MLRTEEILSTIQMLHAEHLDVRTVTLALNVDDCSASSVETLCRKLREKILRHAGRLVEVCDRVGGKYGIPVTNKRIAISPVTHILAGHGRAAAVEVAMIARRKGLTVVTVSSHANARTVRPTHSSGKVLSDLADIAVDNCVEPEDSQVEIGRPEKVAAGSTMAAVFIAMSLVAETGARLVAKGHDPVTFVSPNVAGIESDHNQKVFEAFAKRLSERVP